jgi:hypothetical protein
MLVKEPQLTIYPAIPVQSAAQLVIKPFKIIGDQTDR